METIPDYLRPVVGYATYHLLNGKSVAQVRTMLAEDRRYRVLSAEDWQQALDRAVVNVRCTLAAQKDFPPPGPKLTDKR